MRVVISCWFSKISLLIRRFLFVWTDEMIAEKRDRIATSGVHHMPSLLGLPCARAPRPSAATCGPGQPVPGSCPASPSAAASLAVPPAITLQSLRRRHRRQFCSPQPWQLRARASSIRRRRHLTPRAGQRHQPLTARPNLPFPTLASSASNQVAPLFFSECSGSTTSEAGPTGGPACPAMPPLPTRLDRSADSSTSSHHRVSCHEA